MLREIKVFERVHYLSEDHRQNINVETQEAQRRRKKTMILGIRDLMQSYKHKIREELPKIYSHDLLNNLFRHPYTKVDFVMHELQVSRITATKYLEALVTLGILSKHRKREFWISNGLLRESFLSALKIFSRQ